MTMMKEEVEDRKNKRRKEETEKMRTKNRRIKLNRQNTGEEKQES